MNSRTVLTISLLSIILIAIYTLIIVHCPPPPAFPYKSYRRLGIRVKTLRYGVIDKVVVKQYGVTIYENVEYVVAEIIDAVEIPEDTPLDLPWESYKKKAEDLIGKNVTIWFFGVREHPCYIDFRGYFCEIITENLGIQKAFLWLKFYIWTKIWTERGVNATYAIGERAIISFIVPVPRCYIKIVEAGPGLERLVLYKYFEKPGIYNITWNITEPEGFHTFYIGVARKIDTQFLHAFDKCTINVIRGTDLVIEDLVITSIRLIAGEKVNVKVKVTNKGKFESKETSIVILLNDKEIAKEKVPALKPDESIEVSLSFKIPLCLYGRVRLKVILDPENVVPESNEANNVYEEMVRIAGKFPDLVLTLRTTKLKVITPSDFNLVLKNIGNATATSITIKIRAPKELVFETYTLRLDKLGVGKETPVTFKVTAQKPGRYRVKILIKYHDACGRSWSKELEKFVVVEKLETIITVTAPQRVLSNSEFTIRIEVKPSRMARGFIKLTAPNGTSFYYTDFATNEKGYREVKLKLRDCGKWTIEVITVEEEYYKRASKSVNVFVFLMRAPASAGEVLAGFIVGSIFSVAVMLSPVRRVISNITRYIINLLRRLGIEPPDWLEEFASIYLEEVFKSYTESERPPPEKWRIITKTEMIALIISIVLMSFVLTYIEVEGAIHDIGLLAYILPQVVFASAIVAIMEEFSESIISKLRKYWAEYVTWPHGCLAFLVSGLLFGVPFSGPSRTLFEKDYPEKEKAIIAIYKTLILLALAGFFAIFYTLGLQALYDAGLIATLSLLFYTLIPLSPLPGHDLFSQSKLGWLITFIPTLVLYVTGLMQLIHPLAYVVIGILCLVILVLKPLSRKFKIISPVDELIKWLGLIGVSK